MKLWNKKSIKKLKTLLLLSVDDYETSYRYFQYLISELIKCVDQIILIGNHTIRNEWEENKVVIYYSDEIYDVEKWRRYVIENWDDIRQVDELYLMNSSVFGPVFDLECIIHQMREHKSDFWGMTKHNAMYFNKEKICDSFIQRYFMCLRKSVINSDLLIFFKKLPIISSYEEADKFFEFKFTKYLIKKGYRCDCFCDTKDLDTEYSVSHILVNLDKLIKQKGFPFIPKILFQIDRKWELEYREGLQNIRIFQYVKELTNYDLSMILEYLIRTNNVYDNLINLNLYFEFESKVVNQENIVGNSSKSLVVAYLFYTEEMEGRLKYLQEAASVSDILIVTDNRKKADILKRKGKFKKKVIVTSERGRDWGALLLTCKKYVLNYKYVCFVHDKKSGYLAYTSLGSSFQDLLWENMLASKEYIENIIMFMEKHNQIGVLLPPIFNMGIYNNFYGNYWTVCYDSVLDLARKIGIDNTKICREKPPISIGSCFWCKVEALMPLWKYNFQEKDFPEEPMPIDGTINHALERIIPYVSQSQDFFSGIVMTKEYGSLYHSNLEYMIQTILAKLVKKEKYLGTFSQMLEWL